MNGAYRVDLLTHGRALERLAARPAVILPLGGCEPFGGAGPVGLEALCAGGIAGELSARCQILCAPTLPFGCSTPFISFPGAAGVKPRTMVNALREIISAYALQGAARVFLVNAAPFNKAPALEAAKRVEAKYKGVKAVLFDINTLLGGFVNTNNYIDRADAALLAVAAYLNQERVDQVDQVDQVNQVNIDTSGISSIDTSGINNINTSDINNIDTSVINTNKRKSVTPAQYRAWKKRGADPQKLRKLFPDGLLLPDNGEPTINITPEYGKELFDRAVGLIREQIEERLKD